MRFVVLGVLALASAGALRLDAQTQFARGQDVAPAFDGWSANADGSYSLVFGYLNRNFQEQLDIPVGPNNNVDLGRDSNGDSGQPTHFYPRRQRYVFKVSVPKDWAKDRKVVWTLVSRGKTSQAKGWLQPEWELNDGVIAENSGGGVLTEGNKAPSITGASSQTITLPGAATLTVTATDDGIPKTRRREPGNSRSLDPDAEARRQQGVRLKWMLFRGPGPVEFEPEAAPAVYGQPVTLTSKVSFGAPGVYVLQAIASDGQLFSVHEVKVNVNPAH